MEAIPSMDNTLMELALQTGMSTAVPEAVTIYPPPPPPPPPPPEKNHGRFKVRPLVAAGSEPCAGEPPSQDQKREDRVKKKVSFPEGEALIKGYAHAPNPWYNVTQCTPDNLVAAYTSSCEKHSVKPIQKLVSQLKRIQDFTERAPLLELRGENVTLKHVETLEEIFKRIQFIVIDLESCHLDDESSNALFDMVEYYESAMQLKVSGNKGIGARGWMACARMIRKTPCLETLEARGCTFGEQGLPAIGRALRMGAHVSVLHMEDCGLASRGVMILAAALRMCDTVHELYLGDNNLQAADGLQLGNLVRNNHALHVLDLRNNHLQDTGAVHVFDALACQATFEQRPPLLHAPVEQRLARPPVMQLHQQHQLGQGRGLRTLVMRNNGLTFHSMPPLAAALTRTTTLQTLNLGQNNLTDEGIFAMKDGLLQNKSLANLYLPLTKISCEGAVALAEYIADSLNIRHLDLQENDIKTAGLLALSMCVKVQRTVTHVDLDSTPKKESAIKDYASQQRSFLEEITAQLQHNRQLEVERSARAAAAAAAAAAAEETGQHEQEQQQHGANGGGSCLEGSATPGTVDSAAASAGAGIDADVACLGLTAQAQTGSASAEAAPAAAPAAAAACHVAVPQSTGPGSVPSSNPLYLSVDSLVLGANGVDSLRCDQTAALAASAYEYGALTDLLLSGDGRPVVPHVSDLSAYGRLASETGLPLNGSVSSVEEIVLYDSANLVLDLEVTLTNASVPRDASRAVDYCSSLALSQSARQRNESPAAAPAAPAAAACTSLPSCSIPSYSAALGSAGGCCTTPAVAAAALAGSDAAPRDLSAACSRNASDHEPGNGAVSERNSEHAGQPASTLPRSASPLLRLSSPGPLSDGESGVAVSPAALADGEAAAAPPLPQQLSTAARDFGGSDEDAAAGPPSSSVTHDYTDVCPHVRSALPPVADSGRDGMPLCAASKSVPLVDAPAAPASASSFGPGSELAAEVDGGRVEVAEPCAPCAAQRPIGTSALRDGVPITDGALLETANHVTAPCSGSGTAGRAGGSSLSSLSQAASAESVRPVAAAAVAAAAVSAEKGVADCAPVMTTAPASVVLSDRAETAASAASSDAAASSLATCPSSSAAAAAVAAVTCRSSGDSAPPTADGGLVGDGSSTASDQHGRPSACLRGGNAELHRPETAEAQAVQPQQQPLLPLPPSGSHWPGPPPFACSPLPTDVGTAAAAAAAEMPCSGLPSAGNDDDNGTRPAAADLVLTSADLADPSGGSSAGARAPEARTVAVALAGAEEEEESVGVAGATQRDATHPAATAGSAAVARCSPSGDDSAAWGEPAQRAAAAAISATLAASLVVLDDRP